MRWSGLVARLVLFAAGALALGALPSPALADEPAQGRAAPAKAGTAATAATITAVASEPWWSDAVFYEIFVRSFADSDGDGIGDFRGLTAKLDVLNDGDPKTTTDLGITGIWLMPIHASPSYHGYDVIDYRSVHPDYGTLADFDHFLTEAKKRGIRVIIDFVMNHSSREHPWFVDAQSGPGAKHRDFYLWRSADPGWTQPWGKNGVWHAAGGSYYYGLFWGGMPDLNLGNPAVETALVEAMQFWLDRGVAGFRVDAAKHFFESNDGILVDQPESHAFVERVRTRLRESSVAQTSAQQPRSDALLVGEIWSDNAAIAPYVADGRFQLAFGFGTAGAVIESARDGLRVSFEQALRAGFADRRREAPFLANHDMARTMRQLGGDRGTMRVAAAALLGLPGTPFIYYGEEIGMQGGASPKDEDKRTPMRWMAGAGHGFTNGKAWHDAEEAAGVDVASQRGVAGSLWSLYRDLIALRRAERALVGGDVMLPVRTGGGRGFSAIVRSGGGERVLVVYNFSAAPSEVARVEVAGLPRVLLAEGLSGAVEQSPDGAAVVVPVMAGRGFAFVRLDAVGGR